MSGGANNYELLIQKLDQFIRKYYLNQLLKGLIYASGLLLALFITINVIEYFLFLPTLGRKILFYGFFTITAGVAWQLIIMPVVHYLQLGRVISHEQAAEIVGRHFSNVQDRLLNVLQLKKLGESLSDKTLIEASINQKIETLKPVPFSAAINLGENKRFLKYLAAPVLVLLALVIGAPSVLKDGSNRLFHNSQSFERPAPFQFNLQNEELKALQFTNFTLNLEVTGEAIPNEVYVEQGGYKYKMQPGKNGSYQYTFSNLQKSLKFNFTAAGFDSKTYDLEVVNKPMVMSFDIALDYPAYTGKKDEVVSNLGDLTIPEGTKVIWDFKTRATSEMEMVLGDSTYLANRRGSDHFTFMQVFKESTPYMLKVASESALGTDSIAYSVQVIPDQYPSITMQEFKDSTASRYIYFTGEVADDYGLRSLYFKYRIENAEGGSDNANYEKTAIEYNNRNNNSSYNYYWEANKLDLKPGQKIVYFFEIWDNDGVNGSKSSRTPTHILQLPSEREMDLIAQQNNSDLKDKMSSAMKDAQDLQQQIQDMRDRMLEKNNPTWEDKKMMDELLQKQKDLQKKVEELQQDFAENTQQQDNSEVNQDLKEKQQKLQELFDNVLTDEMKKMFEELEQLSEQMDKNNMLDQLEDFDMTDEQLEQEMDRMLSLFKQLEFEQQLDETVDKLQELSEKQQELSEKTSEKNADNADLQKQQEDINKKLDDIAEDIEHMQQLQQEMDKPDSFGEINDQMEQTQQQTSDAMEQMQQNKNKKASEQQKNAAQKMQQMSQSMAQMQQQQQMQQMQLDMASLRQLLENLMYLSFQQEQLMDEVRQTNINDPKYVKLVQDQNKLRDDTKMVEDSLYALAKRLFQIESFVTDELHEINRNLKASMTKLEARDKFNATTNQQLVMTGYNNLALMFSEVMDQLQQQMSQQMPGMSQCQKPGNNPKPSMNLSQMQQQLNEQLEQMKKGMKEGKMPGGQSMSEAMAKAAAQQKAIRQALQKLNDAENKDGTNSLGDLDDLMDQMDKTETDLVNKQLTDQMVQRQQEILTRLLDAEDAIRQRDLDNERKSKTATQVSNTKPPSLEEYLRKREAEIQLYKTVPPSLKPYYRNLVESYFKNISF